MSMPFDPHGILATSVRIGLGVIRIISHVQVCYSSLLRYVVVQCEYDRLLCLRVYSRTYTQRRPLLYVNVHL
mgnify:CR=1 FL=1